MQKLILLAMTVCAFNAGAGNDGGGGGGFCVNGQCVTLAESGLRIQNPQTFTKPIIDAQVFVEVENIVNKLPIHSGYKKFLIQNTAGQVGIYSKVLSYNTDALNKIKMEYNKILSSQNMSSENLVIYALSSDKLHTYLLPEFEMLNTRSKALILIHEGIVRLTGSVMEALKADGAILDLLSGKNKVMELVEILLYGKSDTLISSSLLAIFTEQYTQQTNSYIAKDAIIPKALTRTERVYDSFTDLIDSEYYCISASDDTSLYSKFPVLWKIMKKYKGGCFVLQNWGSTISLDETRMLSEVCKKAVTGYVITSLDYRSAERYQEIIKKDPLEAPPRSAFALKCENGSLMEIYNVQF